jgi:hypothetical protein
MMKRVESTPDGPIERLTEQRGLDRIGLLVVAEEPLAVVHHNRAAPNDELPTELEAILRNEGCTHWG